MSSNVVSRNQTIPRLDDLDSLDSAKRSSADEEGLPHEASPVDVVDVGRLVCVSALNSARHSDGSGDVDGSKQV